tara:strand:- start:2620 stop:2763 length:144 start_codon:yes stop_codon:yes gene_type:complete
MLKLTEQEEQRKIEEDIVDEWNYQEAEDYLQLDDILEENGTTEKDNI